VRAFLEGRQTKKEKESRGTSGNEVPQRGSSKKKEAAKRGGVKVVQEEGGGLCRADGKMRGFKRHLFREMKKVRVENTNLKGSKTPDYVRGIKEIRK